MVTVRLGRPFWLAFTAFVTTMGGMFGVEAIDITVAALRVSLLGALVVSTLAAAAVYGQAKLAEFKKRNGVGRP